MNINIEIIHLDSGFLLKYILVTITFKINYIQNYTCYYGNSYIKYLLKIKFDTISLYDKILYIFYYIDSLNYYIFIYYY